MTLDYFMPRSEMIVAEREPHASNIKHIQDRILRRELGLSYDEADEFARDEVYLAALDIYREQQASRES